jgi:hypothetical protein
MIPPPPPPLLLLLHRSLGRAHIVHFTFTLREHDGPDLDRALVLRGYRRR